MSTNPANGQQTADETEPSEQPADEAPSDPEAESGPDDTEGPADPAERIEALTEKVEALEEERDELNDKVLRKAAEFENFRRRMNREKERRHEAGMIEVIEPILEVLDDFERSLDAAEELEESQDPASAYESLKGGVEMVFRKFRDTLETLGVEPIEAEGEPFDESLHEAMMRQPSEEAEPGTVLQEIRTGYRMDDRVIRYSRVVVAAEPSEQEAAEDDA
ncbi:MAG: nucleotide exchange factor GrpE [Salinibacter sp.]